jgi:hypothetical protein
MDGIVYTPGAGHRPPVLAGREPLLQRWDLMLNNLVAEGRVAAQDLLLLGARGVGKTALLNAFADAASAQKFQVINLQGTRGQQGLVADLLRWAQEEIQRGSGAWGRAKAFFERIGSVALGIAGVSGSVSVLPNDSAVQASPGAIASALAELASETQKDHPSAGVLLTVDEMQSVADADLNLLATVLHRLNADHSKSAVAFAGAGLPNTPEVLDKAGVTHSDRLFTAVRIPLTLEPQEALFAIIEPARRRGVTWEPAAAADIVAATNGHPAHLQLFAHQTWQQAPGPDEITAADTAKAIPMAAEALEERSFLPRWQRLSDRQIEFLAALSLNGGSASMGRVAETLGKSVRELSWLRSQLVKYGDIYSPRRSQISLTAPAFGPFILQNYSSVQESSDTELATLSKMRSRLKSTSA